MGCKSSKAINEKEPLYFDGKTFTAKTKESVVTIVAADGITTTTGNKGSAPPSEVGTTDTHIIDDVQPAPKSKKQKRLRRWRAKHPELAAEQLAKQEDEVEAPVDEQEINATETKTENVVEEPPQQPQLTAAAPVVDPVMVATTTIHTIVTAPHEEDFAKENADAVTKKKDSDVQQQQQQKAVEQPLFTTMPRLALASSSKDHNSPQKSSLKKPTASSINKSSAVKAVGGAAPVDAVKKTVGFAPAVAAAEKRKQLQQQQKLHLTAQKYNNAAKKNNSGKTKNKKQNPNINDDKFKQMTAAFERLLTHADHLQMALATR